MNHETESGRSQTSLKVGRHLGFEAAFASNLGLSFRVNANLSRVWIGRRHVFESASCQISYERVCASLVFESADYLYSSPPPARVDSVMNLR